MKNIGLLEKNIEDIFKKYRNIGKNRNNRNV